MRPDWNRVISRRLATGKAQFATPGLDAVSKTDMRALAILMVLWGGQTGQSQPQRTPVETIQLTLTRQTPWQGLDGWCSGGRQVSEPTGFRATLVAPHRRARR